MTEKKKIGFAVIGQGHIGKRHAEMIRRNPNCQLIAVCDIKDPKTLGLENIVEEFYSNIDDLLEKEKNNIDVINICVPNGLHFPFSMKALENRKHVVIEKPMALTRTDAEAIIFKSLEVSRDRKSVV